MASREIFSKSKVERIWAIQSYTTNSLGLLIDMRGADSGLITIESGTITDGTFAFAVEVDENDDAAFFNPIDVPDSELRGATAADLIYTPSDDFISKAVGVVSSKRFWRLKVVVTGSPGTGGVFQASIIKQHLSLAPATS